MDALVRDLLEIYLRENTSYGMKFHRRYPYVRDIVYTKVYTISFLKYPKELIPKP